MSEVEQFDRQIPHLIIAWSKAMRCGYSIVQVMEATAQMERTQQPLDTQNEFTALQAVESVPYADVNPAAAQFAQVVREFKETGSLLTALENLQQRLPGSNLALVMDTIKAHRQVGGNLADILEVLGLVLAQR